MKDMNTIKTEVEIFKRKHEINPRYDIGIEEFEHAREIISTGLHVGVFEHACWKVFSALFYYGYVQGYRAKESENRSRSKNSSNAKKELISTILKMDCSDSVYLYLTSFTKEAAKQWK